MLNITEIMKIKICLKLYKLYKFIYSLLLKFVKLLKMKYRSFYNTNTLHV